MIEEQKLEEAVEWYEEDEIPKHLKTLLDLAEQFLALKEFPEKKEAVIPEHTWYNRAIDQCKLASLKAPGVSVEPASELRKTVEEAVHKTLNSMVEDVYKKFSKEGINAELKRQIDVILS